MKRVIKNNLLGFILGAIIFGSIGVYASSYIAKDISFTPKNTNWKKEDGEDITTVKDALDDLYIKTNKEPVQVATLTTQGASYTMQNDGYIVGTATASGQSIPCIYYNDDERPISSPSNTSNVSLYAIKGTIIRTRDNVGTYNLTVYEWK